MVILGGWVFLMSVVPLYPDGAEEIDIRATPGAFAGTTAFLANMPSTGAKLRKCACKSFSQPGDNFRRCLYDETYKGFASFLAVNPTPQTIST